MTTLKGPKMKTYNGKVLKYKKTVFEKGQVSHLHLNTGKVLSTPLCHSEEGDLSIDMKKEDCVHKFTDLI